MFDAPINKFGINSINKRAKDIGGQVEINQLERGTEVKLILKYELIDV